MTGLDALLHVMDLDNQDKDGHRASEDEDEDVTCEDIDHGTSTNVNNFLFFICFSLLVCKIIVDVYIKNIVDFLCSLKLIWADSVRENKLKLVQENKAIFTAHFHRRRRAKPTVMGFRPNGDDIFVVVKQNLKNYKTINEGSAPILLAVQRPHRRSRRALRKD